MKKQILNDALNEIKEEYIFDAKFGADIKIIKFNRKKIITAVACFVLVLLMVPAVIFGNKYFDFWPTDISSSDAQSSSTEFEHLTESIESSNDQESSITDENDTSSKTIGSKDKNNNKGNKKPLKPYNLFSSGYISASELAGFFAGREDNSTTAYDIVYYPSKSDINPPKIPTSPTVTLYKTPIGLESDVSQFSSFIDRYINKAGLIFCQSLTKPEIENGPTYLLSATNNLTNNRSVEFNQTEFYNILSFTNYNVDNSGKNNFVFQGITICVDQRQSDQEIIKSLTPLRNKMSEFFGCNFTKTFVTRDYSGLYEETLVDSIRIEFKTDDSEGIEQKIHLYFDNFQNHKDDIVTQDIIYDVKHVSFYEERAVGILDNVKLATVRRISLTEAETLLKMGYTFGGHSCYYCQSLQDPITFDTYDYVGFVYLTSNYIFEDGSSHNFPFYVFYKYIKTEKNGKLCYAKTYVPAFEVSGIEEYFLNKHSKH